MGERSGLCGPPCKCKHTHTPTLRVSQQNALSRQPRPLLKERLGLVLSKCQSDEAHPGWEGSPQSLQGAVPGSAATALAIAPKPSGTEQRSLSPFLGLVFSPTSPALPKSEPVTHFASFPPDRELSCPHRIPGFPEGHSEQTTRCNGGPLRRRNPPGLVRTGRNESRPRDLPWLWADAQLPLTSPAV